MKRIVLGISIFLLLVQNGFAKSDAEWDKLIANSENETIKEMNRCNKVTLNHKYNSDVNICIISLKLLKKNYPNEKKVIAATLLNIGVLYILSKGDKLKAYEYYMKAAKLGNTQAQKNLDITCKESPWVCK